MIAAARARLDRLAARAPRAVGARAALRTWFSARSLREQGLIAALGAVAVAFGLIVLVVRPIQSARARLLAEFRSDQLLEARLRAAGPALPTAGPVRPRGNPAAIVAAAAQRFGLVIQRIEPEDRRLRVTLNDVPFQAVLEWFADLDGAGIPAAEARFDRQATPGHVDAQLLLGR